MLHADEFYFSAVSSLSVIHKRREWDTFPSKTWCNTQWPCVCASKTLYYITNV